MSTKAERWSTLVADLRGMEPADYLAYLRERLADFEARGLLTPGQAQAVLPLLAPPPVPCETCNNAADYCCETCEQWRHRA